VIHLLSLKVTFYHTLRELNAIDLYFECVITMPVLLLVPALQDSRDVLTGRHLCASCERPFSFNLRDLTPLSLTTLNHQHLPNLCIYSNHYAFRMYFELSKSTLSLCNKDSIEKKTTSGQ